MNTPTTRAISNTFKVLTVIFITTLSCTSKAAEPSKAAQCLLPILNQRFLSEVRKEVAAQSPQIKERQLAIQTNGMRKATLNPKVIEAHNTHYNHTVEDGPVTDQQQAGDCWTQAGCNQLLNGLIEQGKMPKNSPGFSKSQIYFYDALEKADDWLFNAINTLKPGMAPADLQNTLAAGNAVQDGGFYEFYNFLVHKYGVIPQEAMPETPAFHSTASVLQEINKQVAQTAAEMKAHYDKFHYEFGQTDLTTAQIQELNEIRKNGMKGVYKVLVTHIGEPPKKFKYTDAKGVTKTYTPHTFTRDFVGYDPQDYVVVTMDPKTAAGKTYTIPNSAVGVPSPGDPDFNIKFLNLSNERMKKLVEKSIRNKKAVWFGADMTHDFDVNTGIMNTDIFNVEPAYGLTPEERGKAILGAKQNLYYQLSSEDHAMTFTGYDKPKGQPTAKYQVKNSWGKIFGGVGIGHMYANWFDRYVYSVVVHKSMLSPQELKAWQAKPIEINGSQF